MEIIRSYEIRNDDVTCLNEQFDLWMIDHTIDDDEGFVKHNYYLARRTGKMMDWQVLSPRIGSSYTKWSEARELAKPYIASYLQKRLEESAT